MSVRILRGPQVWGQTGRLPLSRSEFYESIVLHDPADPFVPGTQTKRVRPVKLASNASGFVEAEIDAINKALVEARDASPLKSKPTEKITRPVARRRRRGGGNAL